MKVSKYFNNNSISRAFSDKNILIISNYIAKKNDIFYLKMIFFLNFNYFNLKIGSRNKQQILTKKNQIDNIDTKLTVFENMYILIIPPEKYTYVGIPTFKILSFADKILCLRLGHF